MDRVSAPNIEHGSLEPARGRFSPAFAHRALDRIEAFLEFERNQLPLWFVACFGAGIAAWLWLPDMDSWRAFNILSFGLAAGGLTLGQMRLGRCLILAGLALAAGCGWIWLRSEQVAASTLDRPSISVVEARVTRVEPLVAKGDVRLTLAPVDEALPRSIRVAIPAEDSPVGLGKDALIRVRARLQPPPPMALPGGHDFARDAWFEGRGAVGRAIGPLEVLEPARGGGLDALRDRIGSHIRERLPGPSGGVATALANGDQAGVGEADAEAMRRSGLAHLLSVSGLHIAAAVGAAMLLSLRLLALSERLALRFNLVLVAALVGASAGIGYTLLTGMQVPTVRACIAAVLVLAGLALGREAISLRLVAVGAAAVMLFRPEAIAGASFQFSFAAVATIVVLHQLAPVRRWLGPREENWPMRALRGLGGLMVTGLAIEIALMPFALYHFHKSGLYGVFANLFAIPLTTFVIHAAPGGGTAPRHGRPGRVALGRNRMGHRPDAGRCARRGGREGRGDHASHHAAMGLWGDGLRGLVVLPVERARPLPRRTAIRTRRCRRCSCCGPRSASDGGRPAPCNRSRGRGSGPASGWERRFRPEPGQRGRRLRW